MEHIIQICDNSHDYDGFVYEEEICKCTIGRKRKKYYFCCDITKKIDFRISGGSYDEFPLMEDDLKRTKKELCLKYCGGEWGKTYNIHDNQDRFKDPTPVMELIAQGEK